MSFTVEVQQVAEAIQSGCNVSEHAVFCIAQEYGYSDREVWVAIQEAMEEV